MPADTTDTPPTDADSILAALETAAAGPREVSSDAGQVTQYTLSDLIGAHKYLAAVASTQQGQRTSGLRFAQLLPPGTVQRGYYPSGAGSGYSPWRRS